MTHSTILAAGMSYFVLMVMVTIETRDSEAISSPITKVT